MGLAYEFEPKEDDEEDSTYDYTQLSIGPSVSLKLEEGNRWFDIVANINGHKKDIDSRGVFSSVGSDIGFERGGFEFSMYSGIEYTWGQIRHYNLKYYGIEDELLPNTKEPFSEIYTEAGLEFAYEPRDFMSFSAGVNGDYSLYDDIYLENEYSFGGNVTASFRLSHLRHPDSLWFTAGGDLYRNTSVNRDESGSLYDGSDYYLGMGYTKQF